MNRNVRLYSVPATLIFWAIFISTTEHAYPEIWLLVTAAASIIQIRALARHYKNEKEKKKSNRCQDA